MRDDYDDDDRGGGASDVILSFLLGERLRETAERGREMKQEVVGRGRALVDEASGYVDKQRQTIEQRKERLAAAVDAGRQAFREERQEGGGEV